MTTPVITETERNELRKRTAWIVASGYARFVAVNPAHLLDLLDAADREAALLEGIEEALTSPAVCVYDDLRHLLASGKGER